MVSKKLLFDASSLIYALKLRKLNVLCDNYIQWLTVYETVNGLWKEAYLVKSIAIKDALTIAQVLREVIEYMNILSPHGWEEEILKIALKLGIYDAFYIVLAKCLIQA